KDVEALDIKGKALAQVARSGPAIEEAIRVHTQILAEDPKRMEAQKRLAELHLKVGQFRAAESAARKYLAKRTDDAEAHRLMAKALAGVGYLGDTKALDGHAIEIDKTTGKPVDVYDEVNAIKEFEKAEALQPGDIDGGSQLAEIYLMRGKDPARAVEVM